MIWIEALGWIAAGLTIATYAMKTMVPLRITAILSSFFFLIYAALLANWPLLFMELVLLPFNIWRLYEIIVKRRQLRTAHAGNDSALGLLRDISTPQRFEAGARVFSRGDPPTRLYLIEQGEVMLEEIGLTLGPGALFGEIAFFTDAKARTATARCETACQIHVIDEQAFLDLYFINPGFALSLMKLITRRLIDGVAANPDLYRFSDRSDTGGATRPS